LQRSHWTLDGVLKPLLVGSPVIGEAIRTRVSGIKEKRLARANRKKISLAENLHATAFLAKALGDENRLRILLSVSHGKKSVSRIVEDLQLSQPLVSHHLKELKRSLLVKVERNGPFIYYEIVDPRIIKILEELDIIANDLLAKRTTF
jgi:DNA-binding transcriptional ArsR family regulator